MEPGEILAALLVENQRRCKPPLDDAEVRRIARSVGRYEPVEEAKERPRPEADWPKMDEAAFYGLAGEVVNTLAPHTEADRVGLLADFLALFGNCVGTGPRVQIGADRHTGKLNPILVGDTSRARKDTALKEALRVFTLVDPEWAKGHQVRGLGSGEGLTEKVKDPPVPRAKGETAPSEDEEGLVANKSDVFSEDDDAVIKRGWQSMEPNPEVDKRYLVVESEWGRMLTVAQREGSILAPTMCMAWDGDVLDITTRKYSVHATNCHVSALGGITLEGIRRQLTKAEAMEGFANRYLFFLVRKSKNLSKGGSLEQSELNALARKVRAAVRRARTLAEVPWTEKADAFWDRVYDEMACDNPGGLLGGVVARNQPQVVRLALIYALLDEGTIDVPHLKAALAVWDYCRASAAYIFGDDSGDDVGERICEELRAAWPQGLNKEAIYSDVFRRNVPARRIDLALTALQKMGRIEIVTETTGKRGRPPTTVFYVPLRERGE